jgi:ATP-dependent Lhr-like helicase
MLSEFHPVVQRWWAERFRRDDGTSAAPTAAQARGWSSIRNGSHTLIAAPTGSGKTLAAFLNSIDMLLREGLEDELRDEVRVVYVSPLKALSADIHRNLAEPRREIRRLAESMGLPPVRINAAIRTGDTPQSERAAILRHPPHILVTTPESLYLLLTAERSRALLRSVRTVIVDEIHAVIESRRGAHLSLSLERLDHVAGRRVQRIGLSATQRPIELVGEFLVGSGGTETDTDHSSSTSSSNSNVREAARRSVVVIDEGHVRERDLALVLPGSALEAVMSNDVWGEVYERLVSLVEEHRTTLVFVNTRRMAERVAANLAERLGKQAVMAHHGSLSKELRHEAEEKLRTGELRALVATASLELGIDIGWVDLVCQLGSPRRIAAFLQRVGRSGHTVGGISKGRLFPLTRDDMVECTALLGAVRAGELDHVIIPEQPLDVLAQQVVAESAAEDWSVDGLYALFTRAYPYRNLAHDEFGRIVQIVGNGYATRRGRRGAFVHHDAVNGKVRGRRGARLAALTSGGAIPEIADYRVVLEPEGTFLGTVNEDFAVESMAGDVFQLGNASWRILRVESGVMRVADAQGEPPSIPFWLGEAPSRSDELSLAVSLLRAGVDERLDDGAEAAQQWLVDAYGIPPLAAQQIVTYLGETKRLLGALPTQETLVLERFFDEAGGMQLILHAPFGARVNRAWGLALRKKFCRTFNFELQAAATDEGLLLSLGPQHSFPLDDVFRYLHPNVVKDTLVQAVIDAPLFQTRWRWNATLSLAVLRNRGGSKVPPPIQRMQAEDVLAAVFPDAAACLENIAGDREVPDHPLVTQALRDCLEQAMDLERLSNVLKAVFAGELRLIARDTPEPSPLSHELVNARPYAFLDDAPLEERRAQAVYTRRALEPSSASDLGALDLAAIERVRGEAWPEAENADELHDALVTCGFLEETNGNGNGFLLNGNNGSGTGTGTHADAHAWGDDGWADFFAELRSARRATRLVAADRSFWVAAERVREMQAVHPDFSCDPELVVPASHDRAWEREDALRELVQSRMEVLGPVTAASLADSFGVAEAEVDAALVAVEARGGVLRGSFTPGLELREWCDRRLLARIHRYTLARLRAEIQPVAMADFMRFLFRWQRVEPSRRAAGPEGLAAVIEQLDGFEVQGAAWEGDVLPARCESYSPDLLDMLCMTGRVTWGRISPPNGAGALLRTSPIALMLRSGSATRVVRRDVESLSPYARASLDVLERRGASFFHDIVAEAGLLPTQVEEALAELAALGLITSDGFSGLRALLTPSDRRQPILSTSRRRTISRYTLEGAGRWARLGSSTLLHDATEDIALMLLRRWGIVFRRLLDRETNVPLWRDLVRVYRRMEAQGRIRGGRFVAGASGEQFALPEAVAEMRAARREQRDGAFVTIGAADPLNLTGIVLPGERVPAVATNRIAFRDGVPVAVLEGSQFRMLGELSAEEERSVRAALVRKGVAPELRSYLRMSSARGRQRA